MRSPGVVFAIALAVVACKKDKSLPYIFGKTIEPPAGMNIVRPGMTEDEVKAKVPDLKRGEGGLEGLPIKETAHKGAKVIVMYDDETKLVTALRVVIIEKEKDLVGQLTKNWGAPASTGEKTTWLDEKNTWRADLSCEKEGFQQCQIDFKTYRPLNATVFGRHPGPFAPLVADAKGDVKTADAEAAGFRVGSHMIQWFDGAEARIDAKDGVINAIIFKLPVSGRDMLIKAWGPPVEVQRAGRKEEMWLAPAVHWRAQLEKDVSLGAGYSLRMGRYTPYVEALGPGPEVAWAPSSLLSKSGTDLAKENPTSMTVDTTGGSDAIVKLRLPPTDWEPLFNTEGSIWVPNFPASETPADMPVKSIWINFAYGPRKDEMFAEFAKKWGEPKELDPTSPIKKYLFRESGPRIEVEHFGDYTPAWRIWVRLEAQPPPTAAKPEKPKKK